MESKKKNTLTLLLIIVIVVIVGLIGYLGFEVINGNIKESQSQEITDEFDDLIPTITEEELAESAEGESDNTTTQSTTGESSTNSSSSKSNSGSSSYSSGVIISGYNVLGTIRIPATGIKYSIFSEPSKTALERGIGLVYTTSGLNQIGNTVLAGHNYRNRLFFSKNKNLKSGDEIIIKDTTGIEVTYIVYSTFVTTSTDTSFYQNYESGKREVTLTTCTDNGTKTGERLIVRAKEK